MPFWTAIKRCGNCARWSGSKADDIGTCAGIPADRRPFWQPWATHLTAHDDGEDCNAYVHDAHKPHPLDKADVALMRVQQGDKIPLRTYSHGDTGFNEALVQRVTPNYLNIEVMNANYRMRLHHTVRGRAGTIIGLPTWGLDIDRPVIRGKTREEHPERALAMLAAAKVGDTLPLVGYPPMDGIKRSAKVLAKEGEYMTIRIGRRKAKMHRRGPLAGLIKGDVYVLDTSDA